MFRSVVVKTMNPVREVSATFYALPGTNTDESRKGHSDRK
jgi:hypothetical protein